MTLMIERPSVDRMTGEDVYAVRDLLAEHGIPMLILACDGVPLTNPRERDGLMVVVRDDRVNYCEYSD